MFSLRHIIVIALLISTLTPWPLLAKGQSKLIEVFVSPRLSREQATAAQLATLRMFQDLLKGGDSLIVSNADTLQRECTLHLEAKIKSLEGKYRKWKVQLHARDLARCNAFFERVKERNDPGLADLDLPMIMTVLAQRLPQFSSHERHIALFGSPIFIDRHNTGYSLTDCWPSDGHMRDTVSPFQLLDKEDRLKGTMVHLIHGPGAFVNDIHARQIKRFWSLWVSEQNGGMVSFSPDGALWERIRTDLPAIPASFNEQDTKPIMYSVKRPRVRIVWDELPVNPPPSTKTNGTLTIAIRWRGHLDLDLYSGFRDSSEQLSFMLPRTSFGEHLKDYLSSPQNEFETIEYTGVVDIRTVQAAINIFSGYAPGGASGEIRVIFGGVTYADTFKIAAERGNRGRSGLGQEQYWLALDLPAIVGLKRKP